MSGHRVERKSDHLIAAAAGGLAAPAMVPSSLAAVSRPAHTAYRYAAQAPVWTARQVDGVLNTGTAGTVCRFFERPGVRAVGVNAILGAGAGMLGALVLNLPGLISGKKSFGEVIGNTMHHGKQIGIAAGTGAVVGTLVRLPFQGNAAVKSVAAVAAVVAGAAAAYFAD